MVLLYSFFKDSMTWHFIQWKIIYRLHKYSMSPSISQRDVGFNISYYTFLYYIQIHG